MYALIVYESMYGNTQQIAETIAGGVATQMRADVVEVGSAPASIGEDVALLVVGGPTHAFGTRIARPRLPGSAARGATKRLRRLGITLVSPAQSFYVTRQVHRRAPSTWSPFER
jgi:hypothetical protein